jgi:hypothetical protein
LGGRIPSPRSEPAPIAVPAGVRAAFLLSRSPSHLQPIRSVRGRTAMQERSSRRTQRRQSERQNGRETAPEERSFGARAGRRCEVVLGGRAVAIGCGRRCGPGVGAGGGGRTGPGREGDLARLSRRLDVARGVQHLAITCRCRTHASWSWVRSQGSVIPSILLVACSAARACAGCSPRSQPESARLIACVTRSPADLGG